MKDEVKEEELEEDSRRRKRIVYTRYICNYIRSLLHTHFVFLKASLMCFNNSNVFYSFRNKSC